LAEDIALQGSEAGASPGDPVVEVSALSNFRFHRQYYAASMNHPYIAIRDRRA
jgi:hypothetical protein